MCAEHHQFVGQLGTRDLCDDVGLHEILGVKRCLEINRDPQFLSLGDPNERLKCSATTVICGMIAGVSVFQGERLLIGAVAPPFFEGVDFSESDAVAFGFFPTDSVALGA